jgi:hypothetical protein
VSACLLGVPYYVNVTPPFTSVLFFSVLITWWNNFGVIGCFETPYRFIGFAKRNSSDQA